MAGETAVAAKYYGMSSKIYYDLITLWICAFLHPFSLESSYKVSISFQFLSDLKTVSWTTGCYFPKLLTKPEYTT